MERTGSRAVLAARRDLRRAIGNDLRRLRLDAGVGLRALARASGVDASHLLRVEAGTAEASAATLIRLTAALGATVSVRLFPGTGTRLRDRFQAPMIEAVLKLLHPRWKRFLEVAVQRPVRGVVDLVLHDEAGNTLVAAESQSEIRRLEQLVRWAHQKAMALPSSEIYRFAGEPRISQLLILRSTRATRALARTFPETLATAYPARSADIFDALTGEATWPGSGILWVAFEDRVPRVLRTPPRGVIVGR